MSVEEVEPPDLDAVVREVEAEAQRLRASGALGDLERELDLLFEELVPGRVDERDFDAVLDRAERAALIDILAPIDERRPGYAQVKRAVRKALLWYMEYIVQQLSTFAGATTRAVRILGERVERLEEAWGPTPQEGTALTLPPVALGQHWVEWVVERLKGVDGRVLHVEAGDGALLRALVAAGLDAYGVEPHEPTVRALVDDGLEVRCESALDHLGKVGEGALVALALSGCVDRLPVESRVHLVTAAASAVAPGGLLVVIGRTPAAWLLGRLGIEGDLASARPFHAETWVALLTAAGCRDAEVSPHAAYEPAGELPATLQGLAAVVSAPDSYAVTARRGP